MNDENIVKRLDVHREELNDVQECMKNCQISIGQHDERLHAEEENRKRQNGLLAELTHGIGKVTNKVDALSLEVANRFSEFERNAIARDLERDRAVAKALAEANANIVLAKEKADKDVDDVRTEFLKDRIKLNWKIIGALAAFGFILLIIILTILTHTFGNLPGLP